MNLSRSGPGLALAAAALFGLSAPAAKLLAGTVDPWLLAGLLYLGSGLGLGLYRAARRFLGHVGSDAPLRRQDLPWLGGAIAAGGIIGPVLLMYGLAAGTAVQSSLLLNLEGVFTARSPGPSSASTSMHGLPSAWRPSPAEPPSWRGSRRRRSRWTARPCSSPAPA
jgi:hypothetical protein